LVEHPFVRRFGRFGCAADMSIALRRPANEKGDSAALDPKVEPWNQYNCSRLLYMYGLCTDCSPGGEKRAVSHVS
jgi:hypothetical protein